MQKQPDPGHSSSRNGTNGMKESRNSNKRTGCTNLYIAEVKVMQRMENVHSLDTKHIDDGKLGQLCAS
jgi:hypothetical protein